MCLLKWTHPQLSTLPGHISQTKPITIKFSAFIQGFPQLISLNSDKDKGSFSASPPGAFIQWNTVISLFTMISDKQQHQFNSPADSFKTCIHWKPNLTFVTSVTLEIIMNHKRPIGKLYTKFHIDTCQTFCDMTWTWVSSDKQTDGQCHNIICSTGV